MYLSLFISLLLITFNFIGNAQQYQVEDLGLGVAKNSRPVSINNRGEVLGYLDDDRQAFLWSPGAGLKILDIPAGSKVVKINNQGQVLGEYVKKLGVLSFKRAVHPFIWTSKNGLVTLSTIKGMDTYAADINDQGHVLLICNRQAYLWENGNIRKIEEASHLFVKPNRSLNVYMNECQQVALISQTIEDESITFTGYRLDMTNNGIKEFIKNPKGTPYLTAMNNQGCLIGYLSRYDQPTGYVLSPTEELVMIENFTPCAINDASVVVGRISQKHSEGTLGGIFSQGTLININESISQSKENSQFPWESILSIQGINSQGQMIAVARLWGAYHAILLNPE